MRTRREGRPPAAELSEARLRGARLAESVASDYGTRDVLEIAKRAGVRVVYERWPLVTAGECEPRASRVCVNLNALERAQEIGGKQRSAACSLAEVIIAHELGHLFDWKTGGRTAEKDGAGTLAEEVAHGFAEQMLRLTFCVEEYEKLWQKQ
jgi:hypothetical protein